MGLSRQNAPRPGPKTTGPTDSAPSRAAPLPPVGVCSVRCNGHSVHLETGARGGAVPPWPSGLHRFPSSASAFTRHLHLPPPDTAPPLQKAEAGLAQLWAPSRGMDHGGGTCKLCKCLLGSHTGWAVTGVLGRQWVRKASLRAEETDAQVNSRRLICVHQGNPTLAPCRAQGLWGPERRDGAAISDGQLMPCPVGTAERQKDGLRD